eukprot:1190378-Prorocentrum_minimum.AAC.1
MMHSIAAALRRALDYIFLSPEWGVAERRGPAASAPRRRQRALPQRQRAVGSCVDRRRPHPARTAGGGACGMRGVVV